MEPRKLPTAVDDYDRKLLADVEQHGWHIVSIDEDDQGPGYTFSVGFFHTLQHPEVIIFGLPVETSVQLINIMGGLIQSGVRFQAGEQSNDIVEGWPVAFTTVPPRRYREFIGYALWFYESLEFPVLQCVWPDKAGLFAWEDGYDTRYGQLQPILEDAT